MNSSMTMFFLAVVGCSIAFPVQPENAGPIFGVPILIEEPTGLDSRPGVSAPFTYALLLSKLEEPEEVAGSSLVEKRSVNEEETEDLETAAGTYALRPLFVYRQQLAYRQRLRDAIRRGNRF